MHLIFWCWFIFDHLSISSLEKGLRAIISDRGKKICYITAALMASQFVRDHNEKMKVSKSRIQLVKFRIFYLHKEINCEEKCISKKIKWKNIRQVLFKKIKSNKYNIHWLLENLLKILLLIIMHHNFYNHHPKRRDNAYRKIGKFVGYEAVEEKINNWLDFPEFISLKEFPLKLTHNYRTYNKCKDILRKLILHHDYR